MNHHIFYIHIRNQITTELLKEPNRLSEIEQKISFEKNETIYTFCSEAANIFYTIQNLLRLNSTADTAHATQNYVHIILDHLTKGEKLSAIDLIIIVVETISPLL